MPAKPGHPGVSTNKAIPLSKLHQQEATSTNGGGQDDGRKVAPVAGLVQRRPGVIDHSSGARWRGGPSSVARVAAW